MTWGSLLQIPPRSDPATRSTDPDLSRAVDQALKETVSDREAARIYLAAADEAGGKIPLAQAVLDWLPEHEPAIARRVLPYRLAS